MIEVDDLSILGLSLEVALMATFAILPIGVGLAWFLAGWRGHGRVVVESILTLPLVLPPTAIGIVLLTLLSKNNAFGRAIARAGIDIMFTWRAAVLASAVMSLPLLVRSARTAFEEIDPRLLGIARTLGDGPWRVFRRVALPLAWRGIVAGALLSFCRALGEFGATILIAGNIPGRTQTLALAIFHRSQTGRDGDALRLVAIVCFVALAAVYATERLARRRHAPPSAT
ncbi:MAG TPA: molybdate ABC transporter permease subunit [Polyangiaceae bacterium]|nr:molybdate ABC transporter permease subunit [Polyangiaceae bacterium]